MAAMRPIQSELIGHCEGGNRFVSVTDLRAQFVDDAFCGADTLATLELDAECAINLRNRSTSAFGLGTNLAVSDGIANTNVHGSPTSVILDFDNHYQFQ
jgi:hypothetical protein